MLWWLFEPIIAALRRCQFTLVDVGTINAMLRAKTTRLRGFRHGFGDGVGFLSMSGVDTPIRMEADFVGSLAKGEKPTKKSDKQKIAAKANHAYEKQQDRVRYAKSHVYLFM